MNPFSVDSSTLKKEAMGPEESEESPLPMSRGQILLQIPGTVRLLYSWFTAHELEQRPSRQAHSESEGRNGICRGLGQWFCRLMVLS